MSLQTAVEGESQNYFIPLRQLTVPLKLNHSDGGWQNHTHTKHEEDKDKMNRIKKKYRMAQLQK